ncbi:MAG: hypothetical protein CNE99_10120 [OM182 bacterium MED-G24]|uniref:Uncharacterized protein n=1 Tax=OM182 bacterium MED-G24 TaxID=1986255 RepID=A0A2A5WJ76_9GAMM|nr:MAG: hypothetical protein CNE99_10120 [OM182 bacterium MED-G24]
MACWCSEFNGILGTQGHAEERSDVSISLPEVTAGLGTPRSTCIPFLVTLFGMAASGYWLPPNGVRDHHCLVGGIGDLELNVPRIQFELSKFVPAIR